MNTDLMFTVIDYTTQASLKSLLIDFNSVYKKPMDVRSGRKKHFLNTAVWFAKWLTNTVNCVCWGTQLSQRYQTRTPDL